MGSARGVFVVVAGEGFGKTVLLQQLADANAAALFVTCPTEPSADRFTSALELAARSLGDDDLAAAIGEAEATPEALAEALVPHVNCVCVDDVGEDPALADLLVGLASFRIDVVVAGRTIPATLHKSARHALTADSLAFAHEEIEALVASAGLDTDRLVEPITQLTAGWPIAVATTIDRLEAVDDAVAEIPQLARSRDIVGRLVGRQLDALSADDRAAVAALSGLTKFDEAVLAGFGDAGLGVRMAASGLPVLGDPGGWRSWPAPVRRSLADRAEAGVEIPDQAISALVKAGEPMVAVQWCLAVGARDRAAELISTLSPQDETRVVPKQLNAAIDTIGPVVHDHPRSLVVQAHVNAIHGAVPAGTSAIERSLAVFAAIDPGCERQDHVEAMALAAMFSSFGSDWAQAERLVTKVEAAVDLTRSSVVAARYHDMKSLYLLARFEQEHVGESLSHSQEALAIWRELGQTRAALTSTYRAVAVLRNMGRYEPALALVESLHEQGQLSVADEVSIDIERASLLPYVGRADEAVALIERAQHTTEVLDLAWLSGWAEAVGLVALAFLPTDADFATRIDAFVAADYTVQDPVQTAVYALDVARAAATAELVEPAADLVERARLVLGVPEWLLGYTEADIAARFGDPDRALELVARVEVEPGLQPFATWRLQLLRAIAHRRLGRDVEALKHLDASHLEAERIGEPALVRIREWRTLEWFAEAIDRGDASREASIVTGVDPAPATARGVQVDVFDEFSIRVGGVATSLSSRKAAVLLKLLIVSGGHLQLDQIVDVLWPEADLAIGRRRLRNVLTRLREVTPDLVRRIDDESVRLGADVVTDYGVAFDAARRSLASNPTLSEVSGVVAALDRRLLPAERYEDWAEQARSDQNTILLRLLDVQAALAESVDDRAMAINALRRAEELDPFPGSRESKISALRLG